MCFCDGDADVVQPAGTAGPAVLMGALTDLLNAHLLLPLIFCPFSDVEVNKAGGRAGVAPHHI